MRTKKLIATTEPKFRVGQVVRINTDYYKKEWKSQQYQRITKIFSWQKCTKSPFGYKFLNKDECNEKFVSPLSKRELGMDLSWH